MASPAWPAPMMTTSARGMVLGDGPDLDVHRHAAGEDVEDCRTGLRLRHDLVEFARRRIALDLEGDIDLLVAVAHVGGEAEEAGEIDLAFDCRCDLGELYATRGGDIANAGGEAGSECVKQELDRGRGIV